MPGKKTIDQLIQEEKDKEQAFKTRQRYYDAKRAGLKGQDALDFANDWTKRLPDDVEDRMDSVPSRGTPH